MASVYEYTNYRKWICDQAKEFKKHRPGWTLFRLAEKTSIQAPYLTNVIKERSHLNQDQIFKIAKAFTLTSEETEFLSLLLEWERSSDLERKSLLEKRIQQIQKSKLNTNSYLKAQKVEATVDGMTKFYMNPELRLTYALLGIQKYRQNLEMIAEKLHISSDRVSEHVKELTELGLIHVTTNGIEKTKKSLHLPKDSPLCYPHQLLMRYRSLQHQQLIADSDKYNFSVTFTADESTKERIQKEFLKFLSTIEPLVQEAPSEGAYQMSFDLFPWAKP